MAAGGQRVVEHLLCDGAAVQHVILDEGGDGEYRRAGGRKRLDAHPVRRAVQPERHRPHSRCGSWGDGDASAAARPLEGLNARQDEVAAVHGLLGQRREVERAVFGGVVVGGEVDHGDLHRAAGDGDLLVG